MTEFVLSCFIITYKKNKSVILHTSKSILLNTRNDGQSFYVSDNNDLQSENIIDIVIIEFGFQIRISYIKKNDSGLV